MNIAWRTSSMWMRATRVPRCGRISTRPSDCSRVSASDTGKRETPKRWQSAILSMALPGGSSSATIMSRRAVRIWPEVETALLLSGMLAC